MNWIPLADYDLSVSIAEAVELMGSKRTVQKHKCVHLAWIHTSGV
jgi:hypothetical protein